jgi:hypothetical protein
MTQKGEGKHGSLSGKNGLSPYPNNRGLWWAGGHPKLCQDQESGTSVQEEADGAPINQKAYLGLQKQDGSGWEGSPKAPSIPHRVAANPMRSGLEREFDPAPDRSRGNQSPNAHEHDI